MRHRLSVKIYERLLGRYPEAMRMYARYKEMNGNYHAGNRSASHRYLLRLIFASIRGRDLHSVRLPISSIAPYRLDGSRIQERPPSQTVADILCDARMTPLELAEHLDGYPVVSFDVFDTLIFRPFSSPTDLFYLVGTRLGCFNFGALRREAESIARESTDKANFEVNIYDIYHHLARISPLSPDDSATEIATECEMCYANPYMKEVCRILLSRGKTLIAISDMYLPRSVIERILTLGGYSGIKKIYVSCEYGYDKSSGKLFDYAVRDFGKKIIHVGDNHGADVRGAERAGLASYHYIQCNEFGNRRRPISLIGAFASMYKGVVNNYLYNGAHTLTPRETFGFVYAAPVAVGFCEWLNGVCDAACADKIFFLARDMYAFHKIYNRHYFKYENEYVSVSRFALQELIVEDYPLEYFKHTIGARCDKGYTVRRALTELGLDFLIPECPIYSLNERDIITARKIPGLKRMIVDSRERIAERFSDNESAAREYFSEKLAGARRICVADLGWSGSLITYLRFLLVERWHLCDEVCGALVAGTVNELAVELICNSTVKVYACDHTHNRDLMSRGDWETEYIRILTLESVFTSEEGTLLEYSSAEDGRCALVHCGPNPNAHIVREFCRGMELFADELESFRRRHRTYFPISAVDAFEPICHVTSSYDYMAQIIGDVVETPHALAGYGITESDCIPLGELMRERGMIARWPLG